MVELREGTVPVENLLLDPNNFRFQDAQDFLIVGSSRAAEDSVQARAAARLRNEGISELKSSIIHNGFLPFERIVVRPFDEHRFIVIEGNRRVASLKWIRSDWDAGVELPEGLITVLDAVPVIIADGIEEDPSLPLKLMGVRHVGGIKPWGGYQRAKLVTELRDDYGFETAEVAARLGMTSHEVNRRYRAFKALEQMVRDEEFGDVAEPDMYPLFHEAVAGSVIKEWLGWNDNEFAFENTENRRSFYELIAPIEDDDGRTRSAKISTREAVRDLREIIPLADARRVLLAPDSTYADALAVAKADEFSKSWVSQVAEAVIALKAVGAIELRRLDDDDLESVRTLKGLADELIDTHRLLAGTGAALPA